MEEGEGGGVEQKDKFPQINILTMPEYVHTREAKIVLDCDRNRTKQTKDRGFHSHCGQSKFSLAQCEHTQRISITNIHFFLRT